MGYFDSARNRVNWNRELSDLREQKEAFMKEGIDPYAAGIKNSPGTPMKAGDRIQITFKELEAMEAKAAEKKNPHSHKVAAKEKQMDNKVMKPKGMRQ